MRDDEPRPGVTRRTPLLTPATEAADAADVALDSPLASLLVGNVIPHGEIVQLMLKPSRWFVLLNSARFAAFTVVILTALHVLGVQPLLSKTLCVQFGVLLIAGRAMASTVEWMGRFYVLTESRVLRVSGIFTVDIQSLPLRKVGAVNFYTTVGERLTAAGCIEIVSPDGKMTWQTVARPRPVHRTVAAAVGRAKSNGCHGL